jgi:hypothetical protein
MRLLMSLVAVTVLVAGCVPERKVNQEKRNKIFMECINAVGTHGSISFSTSSDKAIGDVVRACDSAAYYQSLGDGK